MALGQPEIRAAHTYRRAASPCITLASSNTASSSPCFPPRGPSQAQGHEAAVEGHVSVAGPACPWALPLPPRAPGCGESSWTGTTKALRWVIIGARLTSGEAAWRYDGLNSAVPSPPQPPTGRLLGLCQPRARRGETRGAGGVAAQMKNQQGLCHCAHLKGTSNILFLKAIGIQLEISASSMSEL